MYNFMVRIQNIRMVRVVVKSAKGPKEINPGKGPVLVCMCGLSKSAPLCDGSHEKTLDENDKELYVYDPVTGQRSAESEEETDGCCGGGCCGGNGCGEKKHEHGN